MTTPMAIDIQTWERHDDHRVRFECPKCGCGVVADIVRIDVKGVLRNGTTCPSRTCDWRGIPRLVGFHTKKSR